MSTPLSSDPPRRCATCGAALEEGTTLCWLCAAPQSERSGLLEAARSPADREFDPWLVNGSAWLAILVVVVVSIGVFNAQMPALGWIFGLTVFPALLFTLAGATLARMMGRPWEPLKKLAVFIAAVSVTTMFGLLLSVLLLIAAIVALLQFCFESLGPR